MKYAIVQIAGKQYKVTEGRQFEVEKQNRLNYNVLYYTDGESVEVGSPFLSDIAIAMKIIGTKRSPKINVGRFKAKSRHQKTKTFRPIYSVVEVGEITKGAKPKADKGEKAEKTERAEETAVKAPKATKEVKATSKTVKEPKVAAKKPVRKAAA